MGTVLQFKKRERTLNDELTDMVARNFEMMGVCFAAAAFICLTISTVMTRRYG